MVIKILNGMESWLIFIAMVIKIADRMGIRLMKLQSALRPSSRLRYLDLWTLANAARCLVNLGTNGISLLIFTCQLLTSGSMQQYSCSFISRWTLCPCVYQTLDLSEMLSRVKISRKHQHLGSRSDLISFHPLAHTQQAPNVARFKVSLNSLLYFSSVNKLRRVSTRSTYHLFAAFSHDS